MHIRRGDAGFPKQTYRRWAAVQEYIDAGNVKAGASIMLLTDDSSTIDEIKEHHPNYNWIYLDRPRAQGVESGWKGHIPSGDRTFEVLAIYSEIQLASEYQTLTQGRSGFMKMLLG
jgi:hypothetical protein